jgi:hypothetical protein
MPKSRARAIDGDIIEVVQDVLTNWSGKLTWDLLIAKIKRGIGVEYTRQALAGHEQISREFSLRKRSLQLEAGRPAPADSRVEAFQKTIDRLKAENEQLALECNNYRALFVLWTHNARKHGLTERMLNAQLSPTMRVSTDDKKPIYAVGRQKKN